VRVYVRGCVRGCVRECVSRHEHNRTWNELREEVGIQGMMMDQIRIENDQVHVELIRHISDDDGGAHISLGLVRNHLDVLSPRSSGQFAKFRLTWGAYSFAGRGVLDVKNPQRTGADPRCRRTQSLRMVINGGETK